MGLHAPPRPTTRRWTRSRSRPGPAGPEGGPAARARTRSRRSRSSSGRTRSTPAGRTRNKIAAVGSSDSHNAGRTPDPVTQSPIGQATTVVYADELSERGIQRGVEAGHTYVKVFGNDGPDLRFEARAPGSSGPPAIMGDTVPRRTASSFTARVIGAGPGAARPGDYELFVLKDGAAAAGGAGHRATTSRSRSRASGTGRYRLQVQRETRDRGGLEPDLRRAADGYARPKRATPLTVRSCPPSRSAPSANASHGAPLAVPSCNPPAPASDHLTVGTPDANGKPAELHRRRSSSRSSARARSTRERRPGRRADRHDASPTCANAATSRTTPASSTALLDLRITDRYNGRDSGRAGDGDGHAVRVHGPVQRDRWSRRAGRAPSTTSVDGLMAGRRQGGPAGDLGARSGPGVRRRRRRRRRHRRQHAVRGAGHVYALDRSSDTRSTLPPKLRGSDARERRDPQERLRGAQPRRHRRRAGRARARRRVARALGPSRGGRLSRPRRDQDVPARLPRFLGGVPPGDRGADRRRRPGGRLPAHGRQGARGAASRSRPATRTSGRCAAARACASTPTPTATPRSKRSAGRSYAAR